MLTGSITVTAMNSPVNEANQGSFKIQGYNLPSGGVTVNYETTPGSATPGLDYTPISGSVFLHPMSGGMATINVSTLADSVNDPNETFSLTLTGVTGDATITTSSATMTIFQPGPPPQGPTQGSLILDPVGTINEGQSFTITGRITPPGTYHLSSIQYNWGGFVTGSGAPASFSTNSSGGFSISNVYFDDGTSPGNGTESDVANISLTASVSGVQLTATTTATVVNVLPTTINPSTGQNTLTLLPEEMPHGRMASS
jgi:hypothetical protein